MIHTMNINDKHQILTLNLRQVILNSRPWNVLNMQTFMHTNFVKISKSFKPPYITKVHAKSIVELLSHIMIKACCIIKNMHIAH
jgi:hypothetical protein